MIYSVCLGSWVAKGFSKVLVFLKNLLKTILGNELDQRYLKKHFGGR